MRQSPLTKEVRRSLKASRAEAHRRDLTRWVLLAVIYLIVVLLSATYFLRPLPPGPDEFAGERVTLQAPLTVPLPSRLESWRRKAEQEHRVIWSFDPDASGRARAALDELLSQAGTITPQGAETPDAFVARLRRVDPRLTPDQDSDPREWLATLTDPLFVGAAQRVAERAYDRHLIAEDPLALKAHATNPNLVLHNLPPLLREAFTNPDRLLPSRHLEGDPRWEQILQEALDAQSIRGEIRERSYRALHRLLTQVVQPNVRFESAATEQERSRLLAEPDTSTLLVLDRLGAVLQLEGLPEADRDAILAYHREAVREARFRRLPGHMGYILIVFVILSFYLRKFGNQFQFNPFTAILISLPIVLSMAVMVFMLLITDGDPSIVGYLFPAGALGMLGVLLLDVRMSLLLVLWGCLLFALQVDLQYQFVITGLFGGYAAVAALYTIRKRYEVFVASIIIGIVNVAVILATSFIVELTGTASLTTPTQVSLLGQAGLGFISGLSSFLVLAILPLFERFGVVTDMQLLELTGLHHPLLRKLEEEAAGTWQHTLNVAKLAEAAATEIGVNYLLVRAGCYYHDIGKMSKPEYFTENQVTPEDKMRHNELKPQMSALIIKNHVKEGIEMAREHNLPERIIDFIREHHGTSVIAYFYHKSLEAQAKGDLRDPVRVEDYRYPYLKPQTIETAIVMLADSVEATATAKLSNRTVREDDIQQVVRTTIFDKFNDGQFNECNLTLRDLEVIRETFVRVLKSRFHTRIDYPKKAVVPRSQSRDDSSRRQSVETRKPELREPAS
jgi:putative nucleotidyltransferase with HDIG domain